MPKKHKNQPQDPGKNLRNELSNIYTPGVPITDPKLFSGRKKLLDYVRDQLSIRGKVFILYGRRGVGKTSFFNVLLHDTPYVKYSCTTEDNFMTIFLNILLELGMNFTEAETKNLIEGGYQIGINGTFTFSGKAAAEETLKPIASEKLDQAGILRRLDNAQTKIEAIVFDEAQNLKGNKVHQQMRSLVKAISDNNINVHIIFVGIAESDEELIPPDPDYSEYKMRHFTTARIPPMTTEEIIDIIDQRENIFNLGFQAEVKSQLAVITGGYPSIAQTLALYSCFSWLRKNATILLKNWALKIPLLNSWFKAKGASLEDIDLKVGVEEFSSGVVQFISEFKRNYEKQGRQLEKVLNTNDKEIVLEALIKIAEADREGLTSQELAKYLAITDTKRLEDFTGKVDQLVECAQDKKWRLNFSRLNSVVRGYHYLYKCVPEQFKKLLNST